MLYPNIVYYFKLGLESDTEKTQKIAYHVPCYFIIVSYSCFSYLI